MTAQLKLPLGRSCYLMSVLCFVDARWCTLLLLVAPVAHHHIGVETAARA